MTSKLSLRAACSILALMCTAAPPASAQAVPGTIADEAQKSSEEDADQSSVSPRTKDAAARKSDDDEIIVTGTNISGVRQVGSESVVISREAAQKTGFTTAADVLRTLPQVRSGEFDREGGASTTSLQNAGGTNQVNLRGLTSTSSTTLILVDGRRTVGTGASSSGVEANQIPIAALERVEVLADGSSAVYGSDAIGGVINYILRKDYRGAEFAGRLGNAGGGFEKGGSATAGTSWEDMGGLGRGNIMVTYDYAHRDPYVAGKNKYLRQDLTRFGGPDRRLNGANATLGYIPSIVVTPDPGSNPPPNTDLPRALTSVYYSVPVASTGAPLTISQLQLNQPQLTDFSYFTDQLGEQNRHQVALYINQQMGDAVELFVNGRYTNRKTTTRTTNGSGGGALTVALRSLLRDANGAVTNTPNAFYVKNVPGVAQGAPAFPGFPPLGIPPSPAAPAADLAVLYPALKDIGPRVYVGSDESFNVTGGVRITLPGKWTGEATYTIGRNQGCTYCLVGSYINPEAFQSQIDQGNINPLSPIPLTTAQLATFSGTQRQIGHNGIDDLILKFNGPLFSLPGGTVRAAFGGERNVIQNWNENRSFTGTANTSTVLTDKRNSYYNRKVTSAFGELYVPIVGEEMNVPLIKSFVVSGAARYDRYSDAGDTANPKVGFTWEVGDILSLAGTWGTSFRSPSITDKNPSAYVSGLITPLPVNFTNQDPRVANLLCFGAGLCFTQAGILFGSNPSVRPEKATNWSLSAQFKPGGGFRAGVSYYNINYRDRLVFPNVLPEFPNGPTPGSNPLDYRGYEAFVVPINNPATCVNTDISSADPALQPFLATPVYSAASGVGQLGGLANFCSIRVLLDSRFTNLSSTTTDGLDVNASWDGSIGEVTVSGAVAANVILSYRERVRSDSPDRSRLGFIGNPVKWRGRGNVGLAYRGANATVFANYTGSFVNDQARDTLGAIVPSRKIPSYTTFDLNTGYTTLFAGRSSPLSSLRYSFTMQNLFDKDPPLSITQDSVLAQTHATPYGRTVTFQITAGF